MIEMAEGKPPYHDEHPMRVLFFIPTKPAPTLADPAHWSADMRDFLAQCLIKDPVLRPDAFQLLNVTTFYCFLSTLVVVQHKSIEFV